MSDYGFKVMKKGKDVESQVVSDFLLSTEYPLLNCFINKEPKHFGNLKVTIGSIQPNETKTILSIPHNLGYYSPHLIEWQYAGGDIVGSTYGTGDLQVTVGFVDNLTFTAENGINNWIFKAVAGEFNSNPITNQIAYFKYYIFGNDFEEVTV